MKVLESSFNRTDVFTIKAGWSGLSISRTVGWKFIHYHEGDIAEVAEIDIDKFRNGGYAAVGAIVGGVLLGGIGLIAGTAYGGRRREVGTYVIKFKDGGWVAFETADKKVVAALNLFAKKAAIRAEYGSEPTPEPVIEHLDAPSNVVQLEPPANPQLA